MLGNASPLELVLLFLVACLGLPCVAYAVDSLASLALGAVRSWRRVRLARYRYEQIVIGGSFDGAVTPSQGLSYVDLVARARL